jgi:hypothetical protein
MSAKKRVADRAKEITEIQRRIVEKAKAEAKAAEIVSKKCSDFDSYVLGKLTCLNIIKILSASASGSG